MRAHPRARLRHCGALALVVAVLAVVLPACFAPPFLAVATTTVTVVDPTRPTPARGPTPAHAGRTLPTTIWYPDGPGPYPLVVFAHGYDVNPAFYDRLLRTWASAGFIVAAPEFPLAGSDYAGDPTQSDLTNQPGDVRAVITQLIGPSSPLAGKLDAAHIAVAGQSDGGTTAWLMAANTLQRDARVSSYLVLSGSTWPYPYGTYDGGAGKPVLFVQGTDDTINLPSDAHAAYDPLGPPKGYLSALGADHLSEYLGATDAAGTVRAATVDWLWYTLYGDHDALSALLAHGNTAGVSSLSLVGI